MTLGELQDRRVVSAWCAPAEATVLQDDKSTAHKKHKHKIEFQNTPDTLCLANVLKTVDDPSPDAIVQVRWWRAGWFDLVWNQTTHCDSIERSCICLTEVTFGTRKNLAKSRLLSEETLSALQDLDKTLVE